MLMSSTCFPVPCVCRCRVEPNLAGCKWNSTGTPSDTGSVAWRRTAQTDTSWSPSSCRPGHRIEHSPVCSLFLRSQSRWSGPWSLSRILADFWTERFPKHKLSIAKNSGWPQWQLSSWMRCLWLEWQLTSVGHCLSQIDRNVKTRAPKPCLGLLIERKRHNPNGQDN